MASSPKELEHARHWLESGAQAAGWHARPRPVAQADSASNAVIVRRARLYLGEEFDAVGQLLTVKKHLEHVFTKLGVENRHAAALRALEAAGLLADR